MAALWGWSLLESSPAAGILHLFLIGFKAYVDELVHWFSRVSSGLMRMRQVLSIPSGVRMEAVTGVTSSLWTWGPRGT